MHLLERMDAFAKANGLPTAEETPPAGPDLAAMLAAVRFDIHNPPPDPPPIFKLAKHRALS